MSPFVSAMTRRRGVTLAVAGVDGPDARWRELLFASEVIRIAKARSSAIAETDSEQGALRIRSPL
jgi:hypothetical protein